MQNPLKKLYQDCQSIEDYETRRAVDFIINSGEVNANDTISEGAAPEAWNAIAIGTIEFQLASGEYPAQVIRFFTSRGISF